MNEREREHLGVLPGKVTSSRYMGDSYRVRVVLDNLDSVEPRLSPNHQLARTCNVDDPVSIVFNPQDTIVYDYPEEGLLDAITPV